MDKYALQLAIERKLETLSEEQLTQVLFAVNVISTGVEVCNTRLLEVVAENYQLKKQSTQLKAKAGTGVAIPVTQSSGDNAPRRCRAGCGRWINPYAFLNGKPYCEECGELVSKSRARLLEPGSR